MPQSNKRQQIHTFLFDAIWILPTLDGPHTLEQGQIFDYSCLKILYMYVVCFDQIYPKFLPVNFSHAPPCHFSLLMSYTLNSKPNEATQCCQYVMGVDPSAETGYREGGTYLKKTDSPSSSTHEFPIAPQLGLECYNSSLLLQMLIFFRHPQTHRNNALPVI